MSGNKDDCWCLRLHTASGDKIVQWSIDCPAHGIKTTRAAEVFAFDGLRLVFPEVRMKEPSDEPI